MDLSTVDEIVVSPKSDDRVQIKWRHGVDWSTIVYDAQDSGYVDPEDILWWLLKRNAPLEEVRAAILRAYPNFDVDGEIDQVTMPDRDECREQDGRRRSEARQELRHGKRGS